MMSGARGRTRTGTPVKASGPKPGASTNFATRAALELQNGEGAPDGPLQQPGKGRILAGRCMDNVRVAEQHYENFPVASLLCPATLRPAVMALYRFARVADDLADEGDTDSAQRRADLTAYRGALQAVLDGRATGSRWPAVFPSLALTLRTHALPAQWLHALLDAFEQDVRNPRYADRAELLHYCARSANPVGRLLLHLYRVGDVLSLRQSDAICTALQLINFWQDLSVDLPRGRVYVPLADLQRHGLDLDQLTRPADDDALRALVRDLVQWAAALMAEGAPLALRLPGRFGWELRLVVQGGLRILEKIAAMDFASVRARPVLGRKDAPALLWRALWMQR
jgi:hydroxysqualene synthase